MNTLRICIGVLLAVSGTAHAANYSTTGAVNEILVDRKDFGQCMIAIAGFAAPGNCGKKWISLDCAGNFNSKSAARSMLETAQIAKATGSTVTAYINDNERINGRCVAYRVILR